MWRNWTHYAPLVRMCYGTAITQNIIVCLQQIKNNYHLIQQFHFCVYIQKNWKQTQADTCTPRFMATLFTIVKRWKQPQCPSMVNG